jgi:hypothetical protein
MGGRKFDTARQSMPVMFSSANCAQATPASSTPTTTFPATNNYAPQSAMMGSLDGKLHLALITTLQKSGSTFVDLQSPRSFNHPRTLAQTTILHINQIIP